MRRSLIHSSLVVFLSLLFTTTINAQNSVTDPCAVLIRESLKTAHDYCDGLGDGTICYGHTKITVSGTGGDSAFAKAGDHLSLDGVGSLHTSPIDVDKQEWGIAAGHFSKDTSVATEAATTPASNPALTFWMVGDVTLTKIASTQHAFTFQTGNDKPTCTGAPNKFIVQTGSESFDLLLNSAEFALDKGTVVVLDAVKSKKMTVLVLTGSGTVSVGGKQQLVTVGQVLVVNLSGDDGLAAKTFNGKPTKFTPVTMQYLPLGLVAQTVTIPALDRWTDTGVSLKAGQSYIILASGLVKTIDYMPWSAPEGHSAADCRAAGRGDWDCRCRTSAQWGTCTVEGGASMRLVGRVGGKGPAFVVGAGGFFAAKTDGELFLGANDNTFTDNVGQYEALVLVNKK